MRSRQTVATKITGRRLDSLAPLGPGTKGGPGYLVYGNASGSLWLLPQGKAGRRAAAALYSPQTIRGEILRLAMRTGLPLARITLDRDAVADLSRLVTAVLGVPDVTLAFTAGPPRTAARFTAVAVNVDNRPVAFLKVATGEGASRLAHEVDVLRRLAAVPRLAARVPRVLQRIGWRATVVVVLTAGPPVRGPGRPGGQHTKFLATLAAETRGCTTYRDSATGEALAKELEARHLGFDPPWYELLERTVRRLEGTFGESNLPTALAHGDFVPWNTRRDANGLWVYDWESARENDLPLMDAFHFAFVPSVLTGRPAPQGWVAETAKRHWPTVAGSLAELRLAYLAGASLQYCSGLHPESRPTNPILARARRELEQSLAGRAG